MTRDEALAWIDEHAGEIPVRDTVNGKLGSYFLTELPPELRELHRQRLATRKVLGVPVHRMSERTTEMKDTPNLGGAPGAQGLRDTVRVAVIALRAGATLPPGQPVVLHHTDGTAVPSSAKKAIGVVDPFRARPAEHRGLVWVLLTPGTTAWPTDPAAE